MDILYIAGSGRCGSTLLSRLLGEIDGFINVGEAALHFFRRCPSIPCGCGEEVKDCLFWKDIPVNPAAQEVGHQFLRASHVMNLAFRRQTRSSKERSLTLSMRDLYRSIAEKTGATVIVDSSKNPAVACALSRAPGIRLSVVHLIRSPQGVAGSCREPKGFLAKVPAWRAALKWTFMNSFAEFITRKNPAHHWRIRYEDFIENPGAFLEAIATDILGRPVECPFLHGNEAVVQVQHILAGNPDKFEHSRLVIEKRKLRALSPGTNLLVSLLTFPLLVRYGYILGRISWLAQWRFLFDYRFLDRNETGSDFKGRAVLRP